MIAYRKHGKKTSSCHWKVQDQLTEPIKGISGRCKKPSAIIENATLLKIPKRFGSDHEIEFRLFKQPRKPEHSY